MKLKNQSLFRELALVNGNWVESVAGATFSIFNPASGEMIGSAPEMLSEDTEKAICSAETALFEWKSRPAAERCNILRKWHENILFHQNDLALLINYEQGKSYSEALAEITYAASFIAWYSEEGRRIYGSTIPSPSRNRRLIVQREPIGVCAAITPWNYPAAMVTRKVAPALAAGCTVVLKPAEQTPFTALALAHLALESGIPPGVLNVITSNSPDEVGRTLCASKTIRHISFTGSTEIGKKLLQQSASTVKKCALELGGSAPFIVFEDSDLDLAAKALMYSKFRNAGQTCVCPNRVLVQSSIYEAFLNEVSTLVLKLDTEQAASELNPAIGPLIDKSAVTKVQRHIDNAVKHGARIVIGGSSHALGGNYFMPTVLTDVTADMEISQEETFGPVVPLSRFETEKDAILIANNTTTGLAAYVFTNDMARACRVSDSLEYGVVGLNTGAVSSEVAPFGGIKESGLGREGSIQGIDEFLETKYICVGGL